MLMGERHGTHQFMPNKFVFPGGRVDRSDARVAPQVELRPEVREKLACGCSPGKARALAMAAVRETFEEAGVLVGRPIARPPRTRSVAWAAFLRHGVSPSLEILDFIARAITPPGSPRRFDTRFFMASAEHIHGDVRDELEGSGELLDLRWVTLAEAKALDLPEITSLVLDEVRKRLASPARAWSSMPVPFVRYLAGRASLERL